MLRVLINLSKNHSVKLTLSFMNLHPSHNFFHRKRSLKVVERMHETLFILSIDILKAYKSFQSANISTLKPSRHRWDELGRCHRLALFIFTIMKMHFPDDALLQLVLSSFQHSTRGNPIRANFVPSHERARDFIEWVYRNYMRLILLML